MGLDYCSVLVMLAKKTNHHCYIFVKRLISSYLCLPLSDQFKTCEMYFKLSFKIVVP